MKTAPAKKILYALLSSWAIGFVVLFAGAWFAISLVEGRALCTSFDSYPAAKAAFDGGNKKLDGNKDGIPCNDLYKKWLARK